MNPLTFEWIEKAEGDLVTTLRELRARRSPNYDAQENEMPIPRTHNLIDLLTLCSSNDATLIMIRPDLVRLDRYAVRFRYPGETANKEEAKAAYQSAVAVRQHIRARLGLI